MHIVNLHADIGCKDTDDEQMQIWDESHATNRFLLIIYNKINFYSAGL